MAGSNTSNTAALLRKSRCGDRVAAGELLPIVYDELRRLASGYMRRQRPEHTLQPTALVHEAYVKLVQDEESDWRDRGHFAAVAARAMRQILVDHARRRRALKRGGPEALRVSLSGIPGGDERGIDLLEIDELLGRLADLEDRKARVVELMFFGGLTNDEVAGALEVSLRTVESDWYMARAWLRREIGRSEE